MRDANWSRLEVFFDGHLRGMVTVHDLENFRALKFSGKLVEVSEPSYSPDGLETGAKITTRVINPDGSLKSEYTQTVVQIGWEEETGYSHSLVTNDFTREQVIRVMDGDRLLAEFTSGRARSRASAVLYDSDGKELGRLTFKLSADLPASLSFSYKDFITHLGGQARLDEMKQLLAAGLAPDKNKEAWLAFANDSSAPRLDGVSGQSRNSSDGSAESLAIQFVRDRSGQALGRSFATEIRMGERLLSRKVGDMLTVFDPTVPYQAPVRKMDTRSNRVEETYQVEYKDGVVTIRTLGRLDHQSPIDRYFLPESGKDGRHEHETVSTSENGTIIRAVSIDEGEGVGAGSLANQSTTEYRREDGTVLEKEESFVQNFDERSGQSVIGRKNLTTGVEIHELKNANGFVSIRVTRGTDLPAGQAGADHPAKVSFISDNAGLPGLSINFSGGFDWDHDQVPLWSMTPGAVLNRGGIEESYALAPDFHTDGSFDLRLVQGTFGPGAKLVDPNPLNPNDPADAARHQTVTYHFNALGWLESSKNDEGDVTTYGKGHPGDSSFPIPIQTVDRKGNVIEKRIGDATWVDGLLYYQIAGTQDNPYYLGGDKNLRTEIVSPLTGLVESRKVGTENGQKVLQISVPIFAKGVRVGSETHFGTATGSLLVKDSNVRFNPKTKQVTVSRSLYGNNRVRWVGQLKPLEAPEDVTALIRRFIEENNLYAGDPDMETKRNDLFKLFQALMQVESGFQPTILGLKTKFIDPETKKPAQAVGLMQVMLSTARTVDPSLKNMTHDDLVKLLKNPRENIRIGGTLLVQLLANHPGAMDLALAAYNAGEEAVKSAGGVPHNDQTEYYVPNVLALYKGSPTVELTLPGAKQSSEAYETDQVTFDAVGRIVRIENDAEVTVIDPVAGHSVTTSRHTGHRTRQSQLTADRKSRVDTYWHWYDENPHGPRVKSREETVYLDDFKNPEKIIRGSLETEVIYSEGSEIGRRATRNGKLAQEQTDCQRGEGTLKYRVIDHERDERYEDFIVNGILRTRTYLSRDGSPTIILTFSDADPGAVISKQYVGGPASEAESYKTERHPEGWVILAMDPQNQPLRAELKDPEGRLLASWNLYDDVVTRRFYDRTAIANQSGNDVMTRESRFRLKLNRSTNLWSDVRGLAWTDPRVLAEIDTTYYDDGEIVPRPLFKRLASGTVPEIFEWMGRDETGNLKIRRWRMPQGTRLPATRTNKPRMPMPAFCKFHAACKIRKTISMTRTAAKSRRIKGHGTPILNLPDQAIV